MSKRLLLLNGLAALMVPLHHAAAYGLSAMFLWTDRYRAVTVPNYDLFGTFPYYIIMISRELHSFAVPAFLFVSGFFVAFLVKGRESRLSWNMVSGRILILLPPFLIWTTFRFLMIGQMPASLNEILAPYWFVILLIQYYLLAPWIIQLGKARWKLLLFGAAFLQFFSQGIRYPHFLGIDVPGLDVLIFLLPKWFFPIHLLSFSLGVVASFKFEPLQAFLKRYKWSLVGAVIATAILMVVEYEFADRWIGDTWIGPQFTGLMDNFYAFSVCLCFLAFSHKQLPFSKVLAELGSRSLGIYLINIPAIYVVAVLLYHFMPWTLGHQLIYQAALVTAGVGGPLILMEFVKRTWLRRFYRYAFG